MPLLSTPLNDQKKRRITMTRKTMTHNCPECGPTNDVRIDPLTLFEHCYACGTGVDSSAPPILGIFDPDRMPNASHGKRNTRPISPRTVKSSQRRWAKMDSHSDREEMYQTVIKEIHRTPFAKSLQISMESLLTEILRCSGSMAFSRIRVDSRARKGGVMEEESKITSADRRARRTIRASEQAWAVALLIDSYRPINTLELMRARGLDEDVIDTLARKMEAILREAGFSIKEWFSSSMHSGSRPLDAEIERWKVTLNNNGLSWTEASNVIRLARIALSQMPEERTSRQSPKQLVEISCLIALVEMNYNDLARVVSESSRTRGIKAVRSSILRRRFSPWPIWPVSLTSEVEENSTSYNWRVN